MSATFDVSFDTTVAEIEEVTRMLDAAHAADLDEMDDDHLGEFVGALKRLESKAEDIRKDVFEEALHERVDEGEQAGDVMKQTGSRRYIVDEAHLNHELAEQGVDVTEAMRFNAKDAEEVLEEIGSDVDEFIGEREYEYFRRL